MFFETVGALREIENIAVGAGIHELRRLRKSCGPARWKKKKGVGTIRLGDGRILEAELHWYEAHGVGRKEMKVKRVLGE
ncbi:MAG: hypothetical protein HY897_23900 [Deltaproteobacteria bacterium]|nr:hypothetical protein [Deltaproteobacteria bacterium]